MKLLRHLTSQPFIVATGIAALVHSTWSIATYFSGPEPAQHLSLEWFTWITVAFLIAFSMDVGQIVTSAEIREGKRSTAKYLTFGIFAAGTYYAQFLYISSHMPVVPMAAGMRSEWANAAQWLRDAAVFILPALLPASTLLYTFSYEAPIQKVVGVKPNEISNGLPLSNSPESESTALAISPVTESEVEITVPDHPLPANPNGHRHGESVNP